MGTRGSFHGGKAAEVRSSTLTSIQCRVQGCMELYLHSPNTSSWRGAVLKKSTGTNLKINICFPWLCETRSLACSEEKLQVLHSFARCSARSDKGDKVNNLFSSFRIVRITESKWLRLAGYVARMETKYVIKNSDRERFVRIIVTWSLSRPNCYFKMNLREMYSVDVMVWNGLRDLWIVSSVRSYMLGVLNEGFIFNFSADT